MKLFKLISMVILALKAIATAEIRVVPETPHENTSKWMEAAVEEDTGQDQSVSLEQDVGDDGDDDDDDVEGRSLRQIELYTNDERCNEIDVCSGMDYGDIGVVASFSNKFQIIMTSKDTYDVKEPKNYNTLTFVNSKFSNFPLQLFYAFKVAELDIRNCSVETLKWDNFLGADKLTILLLSENLLEEIKPSVFTMAENLSFLFLDSNRISRLHYDSFKNLQKLNFLDLHNNLIETLPSDIFSYLPSLQQINLAQNRIQFIGVDLFSSNPRLFSIHLQQNALNQIQDYAFQHQNIIKYLDISHNPSFEILVAADIKVENLWAKNCSIYRVNIYGEAVHVDLQQNFIKELYFSQPEYLETLRLKENALEQISSLSLATNLRTLDVSCNPKLETLPDLMQINSLERLDLSNTSLKEIPINLLMSPNKLRSLNVSFNQIEEINPLNFKYLEKLSQFYLHHNNWNCYNLKMLMDMVIAPLKISYTRDIFDEEFPGEYIHGIKCMYRIESADDEYYVDAVSVQQVDDDAGNKMFDKSPANLQEYDQLNVNNTKEVEQLRRELKAIMGIYEQKFSFVLNKLNDLDLRLKEFERYNESMWRQVAIVL